MDAINAIRQFATIIEPQERIGVVKKDESDNRVLECAFAARTTIVFSGDSHLLELGSFQGMRILRAGSLLEAIAA
jgi:uncharacterized protein